MQIKFYFNNFARLPQLGSVPAAYAVVSGGCDWPIQQWLTLLRSLRCVRCVGWKPRSKHKLQLLLDLLWI